MADIGYIKDNNDVFNVIYKYGIFIPSYDNFIWVDDTVMINIHTKSTILKKYDQDYWSNEMDSKIKECNGNLIFKVTNKYKYSEQDVFPWWSYLLHEKTGTNFYMLDESLLKIDILSMYKPKNIIRTLDL